jgi:hypothetical protein
LAVGQVVIRRQRRYMLSFFQKSHQIGIEPTRLIAQFPNCHQVAIGSPGHRGATLPP